MNLNSMLPAYKVCMRIEHNEHKVYYETIEEYILDRNMYSFKDDESRKKSISTNEIWTLQWYPETPVGFCSIAAPTFESLMEYAKKCQ